VRGGTAEEIFEARKRRHETDTIRDPKDLGFHAVIGMFGADKIAWRIVSSKSGRQSEVQAWANAEEIRLISQHGGVLRDMDSKLEQTLNLTKGGKGDPAAVWAGIEARRRLSFTKFKAAMEAYVEEHESALVPSKYVDDDGYTLGSGLSTFRKGVMRKGMPDEADIVAWAEALPKWHWDGRESDEFRQGRVDQGREKSRIAFTKFKAAMEAYVAVHESALVPQAFVDDDGYALGSQLNSFRQGTMRKGMPNEAVIDAWAEALPKWHWNAQKSDEFRQGRVDHGQERSRIAFAKFKVAMEAYVAEHGSALVPNKHVDDDGYKLGARLNGFRTGNLWKGTTDEVEVVAWAEALPKWSWKARETDEFHQDRVRIGQKRSQIAFSAFKVAMEAYVAEHDSALVPFKFVDADGYALGSRLLGFRQGQMWKGATDEAKRVAWAEALPKWAWDARDTDEFRQERAQRRIDQAAAKRRAELVRARSIAVPFVKSQKRRKEMRAASTDFLGKGGIAVLYMVSNDKETIRRVDKDGMMREREIVGPVVDPSIAAAEAGPSNPNAFVTDSDSD